MTAASAKLPSVRWENYEVGPTGLQPVELKSWVASGPSRVLLDHQWHPTLVEEMLELPGGRRATWVRHADEREGRPVWNAAGAICRRDDGKILVAWQWNPGRQDLVAEFPGGRIDPGETDIDAVRREVAEEVGLLARTIVPLGRFYFDHRRSGRTSARFLCSDLMPVEATGEEVQIATAWLTEEDIEREIGSGSILSQSFLATWALYRSRAI